jgi:hypothetical protein
VVTEQLTSYEIQDFSTESIVLYNNAASFLPVPKPLEL